MQSFTLFHCHIEQENYTVVTFTGLVKSSTGVENVRAMPNPTRTGIPGIIRSQNNSSNLFTSDTDDDGDLFSSKPQSSGKYHFNKSLMYCMMLFVSSLDFY